MISEILTFHLTVNFTNLAPVLFSMQDTDLVFYILLSSGELQKGAQSSSGSFGE